MFGISCLLYLIMRAQEARSLSRKRITTIVTRLECSAYDRKGNKRIDVLSKGFQFTVVSIMASVYTFVLHCVSVQVATKTLSNSCVKSTSCKT